MTHPMLAALTCSLALSVGAEAGGQTSGPQTARHGAAPKGTMTVMGCLQTADASTSGAPGASGASASSRTNGASRKEPDFVLIPAVTGGSPGKAAPGGNPKGSSAQPSYRLFGNIGEMNKMVNHRVEVTGTLEAGSGVDASAPPATSAGSASGRGASTMPRLRVVSARELPGDTTCGPATQN
jgi:hypothetical protein